MRVDGDPIWRHDDECSLEHPCVACLRDEALRAADEAAMEDPADAPHPVAS